MWKPRISSDALKLIALVSMTIDHLGYLLFPQYFSLRVIGRLAFPIYAYYVAVGVEKSHDVYKYLCRVSIFAILTQIIFYVVGIDFVNVMFTYAFAIAGLIGYKNHNPLFMILAVVIAGYMDCDYSYYGVLVVYIFYFLKDQRLWRNIAFLVLTGLFIFEYNLNLDFESVKRLYIYRAYNWELIGRILVEYVAFAAFPLIDMDSHKYTKKQGIMKYFFYIYYPLHLVIFKLISLYL